MLLVLPVAAFAESRFKPTLCLYRPTSNIKKFALLHAILICICICTVRNFSFVTDELQLVMYLYFQLQYEAALVIRPRD